MGRPRKTPEEILRAKEVAKEKKHRKNPLYQNVELLEARPPENDRSLEDSRFHFPGGLGDTSNPK
jgi:hypothetical protein